MSAIELIVDEFVLRRARQFADEEGTTVEALLAVHLALLVDQAGRRLTVREQLYADHKPSKEVVEALRAENAEP